MTGRVKEIDYIRAIAAFSVIAIHVTSGYVAKYELAFVLNQFVRYAVPLFVILSGYSIHISSGNKKSESYFQFISVRINKIFIPYFIWSGIYFIYYRYDSFNLISWKNLNTFMDKLLKGTNAPHLYFIIIILQLYFLYPILKKLLQSRYRNTTLLLSFLTSLYFQSAIYLWSYGFRLLPSGLLSYYYILFPTWLFYFVFGAYSSEYKDGMKRMSSSWLLSISWIFLFIILLLESKLTNTPGSSMKPTIILYTIISFIFFYYLTSKLKTGKLTKFLDWISSKSFMIYLSHILVMAILQKNLPSLWIGNIGMLLLFVTTSLITLILVQCLSWIKNKLLILLTLQ